MKNYWAVKKEAKSSGLRGPFDLCYKFSFTIFIVASIPWRF